MKMPFLFLLLVTLYSHHLLAQGTMITPSESNHKILAEAARNARNPNLSAYNRREMSNGIARYIQKSLSDYPELKTKNPAELKEYFINHPSALDDLKIANNDPLRLLITEFGQLLNFIEVSEKLKKCQSNPVELSNIANKMGTNYSICDQGQRVYGSVLYGDKLSNSVPNYFYFDNFENISKIVRVANYSSLEVVSDPSEQLGGSVEKIKAGNPGVPEKGIFEVGKQIELRKLAYIRALTNSYKTVAMMRTLYQNPGLDPKNLWDLTGEIKSNCKGCTDGQVKLMIGEIATDLYRDMQKSNVKHLSNLEITNSICDKLSSRGYKPELKNEFDQEASDKEVISHFDLKKGLVSDTITKKTNPKINFQKPDSNKVFRGIEQEFNEKDAILGTIGQGWEGLLLMTPTLTKKLPDDSPYRVNLDCLNRANPKNDELIIKATNEARRAPVDYVEDLNKTIDFGKLDEASVRGELKTLMKENKRSIGESLVSQPELADVVCSLSKELDKDTAIAESKTMALTWGTMIVGGALELTGVGAPLGAWLQGTVIATEVVGGMAAAYDMNENAKRLNQESKGKLGSAKSTGDDEDLMRAGFKAKEESNSLSDEARFTAALTAVGALARLPAMVVEKNAEKGLIAAEIKPEAKTISLGNKSELKNIAIVSKNEKKTITFLKDSFQAKKELNTVSNLETSKAYFSSQGVGSKKVVSEILDMNGGNKEFQGKLYDGLYKIHLAGGAIENKITLVQLRAKAIQIQELENELMLMNPSFNKQDFRKKIRSLMDDGTLGIGRPIEVVSTSLKKVPQELYDSLLKIYPPTSTEEFEKVLSLLYDEVGEVGLEKFIKNTRSDDLINRVKSLQVKCGKE